MIIAVAALFGVFALEITSASRDLSATWNEPYHLLAGLSYWQAADYGVNPEHPPLAKLVGALPLLFMPIRAPRVGRNDSKHAANNLGSAFVYGMGNDTGALLLRARLADAAMGLLLILLLFEAGYRMFGAGVAWIAAVLGVFEPNLVAHSALITTDLACAVFFFAAVYAFWRVAERPTALRLAGCGVVTGLALASKHSALLVIPVLALLAATEIACRFKSPATQRGGAAAKTGELTPHSPAGQSRSCLLLPSDPSAGVGPAAHGRHPLPMGEGTESPSFSLGEKVAEGRGRMRGLVIPKLFAEKTTIDELAMQNATPWRMLAREIRTWLLRLFVICGLALVVLWGFYGFRFAARPDGLPLWMPPAAYAALLKSHLAARLVTTAERFKLLPQAYLFGLTDVLVVTAGPRMSFLLGRLYPHALWYYFPVDFVIKSTLGFLGLLVLGVAALKRWSGEHHRLAVYLLFPPALFMAVALTAGTNMGIRHVLPIYPFLILAAAAGAWALARTHRAWAIVVAACVILHAASSLRTLPDYLAYSNELFGGTSRTYQNLSFSNADWGQGIREVQQYLERRNIHDCWMAYIGSVDPAYYRGPCQVLPNPFLPVWQYPVPPDNYHGVVLVGGTQINGTYWGAGPLNPYRGFLRQKPVAVIGGSVLVYKGDIDLRGPSAIAHMARAWDFYFHSNQEAAIQEALKAADLAPDHPGPPYILGFILARAKRTEAAREQLETSLKLAEAAGPEYDPMWETEARGQLARLPK